MRVALYIVVLACASKVQGALIVSPGPPAVPADFLEMDLTWEGGSPAYALGRAVDGPGNWVEIVDDQVWLPQVPANSPAHLGQMEISYGPAVGNTTNFFLMDFRPEVEAAGLASVDVTIGALTAGQRTIDVSGAGGYARSFTVVDVPEPTTSALALLGCCALRRLRR
jgi:hypothetical protein